MAGNAAPQPSDPWDFRIGTGGRLLFVMATVQGQPIQLLVDTGCTRTGFDIGLQPALGNPLSRTSVATPAGIIQVEEFNWPNVELGGRRISSDQPVFCHDFRQLQKAVGEDFAGILGMDVLRHYVVQIDFDEGVFRLSKELPTHPEGCGSEFDIIFSGGVRPHLLVSCGKSQQLFLIDTGSTNTCIDTETFDALVESHEILVGHTRSVATAAGCMVADSGLVHQLALGHFVHQDLHCDRDALSILGLPYLARYRIVLDFPNYKAYLCEGRNYSKSDPRGFCGLQPVRTLNGFVVQAVTPHGPAADAGLQLNDEINEIDGEPTSAMDMFRIGELLTSQPGRVLRLKLRRHGDEFQTSLTIGERIPRSE
jgi:hypothetical protein